MKVFFLRSLCLDALYKAWFVFIFYKKNKNIKLSCALDCDAVAADDDNNVVQFNDYDDKR